MSRSFSKNQTGPVFAWVVVVPEAHALPFEPTPATNPNFWANLYAFWAKNQATADEELFHDIIPFIQTHYNISDEPRERAIAGFSMGGLQAMETGIVHLGYFSWIGAFSPGRDELIEKSVVLRQASFLLVALQQKLLAIPTRVSRRCVGKDFAEIHQILSEEITRALQEMRDLRKAGIDPDWEPEQEDFSRRSRG